MQADWQDDGDAGAIDPVTDYRLTRDPSSYPRPLDEIWWAAIFHLEETSLDEFRQRAEQAHPGQILIPDVYDAADCAARPPLQSVTLIARSPVVRTANTAGNGWGCGGAYLGCMVPEAHLPLHLTPQERERPAPKPIKCDDDTVVTAVIDDAIGFANALFRDRETSSRVHLAYIMSSASDVPHRPGWRWEVQGRSLDKRAIDRLLKTHTSFGLTDEDTLYVDAGAIDFAGGGFSPLALRESHGTHVAALAAGHQMHKAPKHRPLLVASLPWRVTEDTSGFNLYPSLLLALHRLEREGRRFRRSDGTIVPMVFNFSYGTLDGPHDGSGLIPRLIQHIVDKGDGPVRRMVLPAGNTNLSRTHAHAEVGETGAVALDLKVLPDDRTDSHVEMWLPEIEHPDWDPVHVTVSPPGGRKGATIVVGSRRVHRLRDDDGREIARLSYAPATRTVNRASIVLSVNRTVGFSGAAALAPAGDWRIEIWRRRDGAAEPPRRDQHEGAAVEVWIRRDDTLPGFPPRGRQAHFNNPDYQKFDAYGAPLPVDPPGTHCPVRRAGTLNGLATGEAPLVVASFTGSNGLISDYSASGPVPSRKGPDAAALGDQSPVLRGVLSAGSRSGYLVRQSGTSVAAPRVARLAVEAIAGDKKKSRKKAADRAWLHGYAEKSDKKHFPQPRPEFARGGAGRVDVPVDLGAPDTD